MSELKVGMQQTKNHTKNQLMRYMVSGASAMLADAFVFYVLTVYFTMHYRFALLLSFTMGTIVNFVICDFFIFQRHTSAVKAFMRHYSAMFIGFILNAGMLIFLIEVLGMQSMLIARLGAATSTFLINFWLIKSFVFKN